MIEEIPLADEIRTGVGHRLNHPWQHCTSAALSEKQLDDFSDSTIGLLLRGKRFRAIGAYIGWIASGGTVSPQIPGCLLDLGTCLELFQASAIVHDDIIDEARIRRGLPSAQIAFMTSSPAGGPKFGESAAILWGDLLFAAANSYFASAVKGLDSARLQALGQLYVTMQAEVAYGQYLDLFAESRDLTADVPPSKESAMEVIRHKTARYSVVIPILIGAALAGATPDLLVKLEDFSTPLGIAYQLRDDDLGIFGSQELTGKPSGDDICAGKRTVQLAVAWEMTDDEGREYLQRYWGAPDLTPPILSNIQAIITGSGARAAVAKLMNQHLNQSQLILDALDVPLEIKQQLCAFGSALVNRKN